MSQLNDPLVAEVFKAMAVHRPQLAAMAALDDEEGNVDVRLLGDQISRNFPLPIGIEVRRLISGGMREPERRRLDQLFRTFERSVQFVAFVMVAQLWKARMADPFPLPASFVNEFRRRAPLVSLGNLTWMVRQIARVWRSTDRQWFVTELGDLVTDRFCDELDAWVPERNAMGHYQVNLTNGEVQRRCVQANDRIVPFLAKLAFLSRYRLVSANDPRIRDRPIRPAVFDRRTEGSGTGGADPQDAPMRSLMNAHAVLLMRHGRNADEYVDLSPFVIDTHHDPTGEGGGTALHKDVFLFSKYRHGGVFYSGSEATERIDLRSLPGYDGLVKEFEDLMRSMCGVADG